MTGPPGSGDLGGGVHRPLARRLGLGDAVAIGVASMLGAGVFAAYGPAAAAAGSGLLVGLGLAAAIAWCNATSSAQLAAQYPTSGGTYVYGRERLGLGWGYVAGWAFVTGKTASCAAMALTAASYLLGGEGRAMRVLAISALIGLTAVNVRGVTKTARLARLLMTINVAGLLLVLLVLLLANRTWSSPLADPGGNGVYGILQSAGLLFFAFAGYARIATLGEEVRTPRSTIPRAIVTALGLVVLLYAAVGAVLLVTLGSDGIAQAALPLAAAADNVGVSWLGLPIRLTAVLACLGALLGLLAGVSRTVLAMSRNRDLPGVLAIVDTRREIPVAAEVAVCGVAIVLVLVGDIRTVIGFSSFGVLLYYAIANAAAATQKRPHRRLPRAFQLAGVLGCVVLAVTLPPGSVVGGVLVLGGGLVTWAVRRRSGSSARPRLPG